MLALLTAGAAQRAAAADRTFTVNVAADTDDATPGDGLCADANGACSLRAAVEEANALSGTTEVDLGSGTYTLSLANPSVSGIPIRAYDPNTGDIDVTANISVVGAGASSSVLDAASLDREFEVRPGGTLQLSDLTVQHGFQFDCDGGYGVYNAGTLTLTGVVMKNMTSGCGNGGAVYSSGTLGVTDTTFSHDAAANTDGGALYTSGTAVISTSTFDSNGASTTSGGAVANAGSLSMTNVTLAGNEAPSGLGGALYNISGNAVLKSDTFVDNEASGNNGGAIRADGGTVFLPGHGARLQRLLRPEELRGRGHVHVGRPQRRGPEHVPPDRFRRPGRTPIRSSTRSRTTAARSRRLR